MKRLDAKGRRILIIPDLHAPFEHPDAFKFLSAVKEKYLKDDSLIINLGDEIDGNQISFHDKDPDMPFSPCTEMEKAIESIQELQDIFPEMHLCTSNHGSLVYRRQKAAGLPRHVIKSYQDILGTPNWHWHDEILVETKMGPIYLCHGKTSSTGKLVKEMGVYGSIQGHYHGKQQIVWLSSALQTRFDAFGGALINVQSKAFAYGKNHLPKPLLGCILISKIGYPRIIRMITNEDDRWIWELP